ncbi:hypothetical protein SLA2020_247930 [Shorea laevis]
MAVTGIRCQVLVSDTDRYKGGGGNEGHDTGGKPFVGGGNLGADVGNLVVFYCYYEINGSVGEGFKDFRIGVVDFDFI